MPNSRSHGLLSWCALLALAIAGQASALALISAPPFAVYQHYKTWPDILGSGRLPALIVALELVAAVLVLSRHWDAIRRIVATWARPWRVTMVVCLLLFASAVPSGSAGRSLEEVTTSLLIAAVSALALLALSLSIPDALLSGTRIRFEPRISLPGQPERSRSWDGILPWLAAAWVVLIGVIAAWLVFERLPHIDDSVSYLFQAKYFSAGHLYLPAPPDSAGFSMSQTLNDGKTWWAYGFPGWPSILAIGAFFGVPWLVNPLLGGMTVLLTHALVRKIYDRGTANVAILLLCVSPWLLYMSGELMGHPVSVVWTLLALLALLRARAGGSWLWIAGAGAALGMLFLTRPLEALLVGPVVVGWAIAPFGFGLRLHRLIPLVVAGGLAAGLSLPYSAALTGDPLYPPHMKWADLTWGKGKDRLGFGRDVGNSAWPNIDPLPGHGLPDVVLNANKNVYMTNFELFGWGCGSLILVLAGLLTGGWDRRDGLCLLLVAAITVGHSIYWFSGGPDLGARYWYQIVIPLVVLSARAVAIIPARFRGQAGPRLATFVALASLGALVTVMPWRGIGKYYHYRGITGAIRHLATRNRFGHSLVFVRSPDREDFQSAFSLNPPTLSKEGTIYVWDQDPVARARIAESFGDRTVWVIGKGAAAGDTLAVLAGPLPPGTPPP